MKKSILSLLLLGLPLFLFSQAKNAFDGFVRAESSFRQLSVTGQNSSIEAELERRKADEWSVNFQYGFGYNRKIANQLWLRAGAGIAQVGYQRTYCASSTVLPAGSEGWGDILDGANYGGTFQRGCLTTNSVEYKHWFVSVPLTIRQNFTRRQISPFLELGFAPSFYLRSRTASEEVTTIPDFEGRIAGFNTFHLVGTVAAGLNFTPAERWQYFGQLGYRYHFTKSIDNQISENLLGLGIDLGVRRLF